MNVLRGMPRMLSVALPAVTAELLVSPAC